MAKELSVNYTDTAVTGGTAVELLLPQLNYAKDFRVTKDEPSEAIITNLTSPLDQPERFRFAHNLVQDVYRQSGIDPTLYYATRKGTQILCQLTDIYKVTDSADASYLALLPVEAHVVIKVPNNDLLTPQAVEALVSRMLAGLYETTAGQYTRLQSMLRGALLPADL